MLFKFIVENNIISSFQACLRMPDPTCKFILPYWKKMSAKENSVKLKKATNDKNNCEVGN